GVARLLRSPRCRARHVRRVREARSRSRRAPRGRRGPGESSEGSRSGGGSRVQPAVVRSVARRRERVGPERGRTLGGSRGLPKAQAEDDPREIARRPRRVPEPPGAGSRQVKHPAAFHRGSAGAREGRGGAREAAAGGARRDSIPLGVVFAGRGVNRRCDVFRSSTST
ncbi:hypothetical protein JKP88DRAFT_304665, partial [Tribonema minus]